MKDLKQLLVLDAENSAAKSEYGEVKQLWEKQLRKLQATTEPSQSSQPSQQARSQRGRKQPSSSKKKQAHKVKSPTGGKEGGTKEKSVQQRELKQLLEETKSKMKELKENPMAFASAGSDYLNASKTTYFNKTPQPRAEAPVQPEAQLPPQATAQPSTRRRKIVVEEERSEEVTPSLSQASTTACTDKRRDSPPVSYTYSLGLHN